MTIHGSKFCFALQRANSKNVFSTTLCETTRGSHYRHKNNNTAHNFSAYDDHNKPPPLSGYLKDMYTTLRGGRRAYYTRISFDTRWDRIQKHLAVIGRVSTGNEVIPYHDSGEAFRIMWNAVDEAKKSVLWQTYICKDDNVGQMTVAKLEAAHCRGCYTELLYDCGGNITGRRRLVGDLKQSGATVIEHRPILDHFFSYLFGGMKWERSPAIRNHRKILLCDNKIGFCGGLNVGNEYCGKNQGGNGRFRDTHCSVVGPAVAHLCEVYEDTKTPKPWKWGWIRWRQIASATMRRRQGEVKDSKAKFLFPTSQSVQQRGRVYLRRQMEKAGKGTALFMERIRRKRHQGHLQNLVEGYINDYGNVSCHGSVAMCQSEKRALEGILVKGELSRTSVMHQRIKQCRMRAPYRVREVFDQRMRGGWVVMTPLCDTEPVPEAEAYSKRHQPVTQILSCNPHSRDWSIPYAFWQVSNNVHRRLWVTTPYYMPHRKLLRAILRAARRGVDVRLLSGGNHTTDPWFMWYASNYITERLLRAGVRIYEYKGNRVMHAKTVVVDSIWSSVGSYNWDMMSNKNMEVCVCHLDYDLARRMEEQFLTDLRVSTELKYDEYKHRSWRLRFLSWFFYVGLQIAERLTFNTFWDADLSSKIDGLD